jgi:hypothetical protein
LPIVLVKTTLLAISASYIASKVKKLNIWHIFLAVIGYQAIGLVFAYFMIPNAFLGDLKAWYPWLILQILVGFLLLTFLNKFLNDNKRI